MDLQGTFTIEQNYSEVLQINKVCLIDADFIKHIASSRAEKVITENLIDDFPEMKSVYRSEALSICEHISSKIRDPLVFCFSGKSFNTFRYKLAIEKEYKGSRKRTDLSEEEQKRKFELMHEAMTTIINSYVCLLFDDLEADDILSMLQDDDTYIFSRDKDLNQIPGLHYDESTNKVYNISEGDALKFLSLQMLTGDATDCINGISGIGPKKAEKILDGVSEKNSISVVYKAYKEKYGIVKGTDLFCQNWLLLKLRINHGDYFKEKYKSAFSLLESIKKNQLKLT